MGRLLGWATGLNTGTVRKRKLSLVRPDIVNKAVLLSYSMLMRIAGLDQPEIGLSNGVKISSIRLAWGGTPIVKWWGINAEI